MSATAKPRRVLQVLHRMDFGGIESWLMNMLRLTERSRLEVDFLVHGAPGAHEAELARLGSRIIRGGDPHRPFAFAAGVRAALAEHGPYDVVHSHLHLYSGWVLRVAAQAGVAVRIAHSHNATPAETRLLRRGYAWLMKRWIRRHATIGLAASVMAAENLYGRAWADDPRWQLLYYGLDLTPFRRASDRVAVRTALGIAADAFVVGTVGRLVAQKNHTRLLRIASAVQPRRPCRLLLVGDGELRGELERQARELGLGEVAVFAGGRSDVADLLRAMDVFVFPSLFEGLGLAVVEAQAAGLPVVAADTTPPEALLDPACVQVLGLAESDARWAEAIVTAHVPPDRDPLTAIAASPFDHRRSLDRLLAVYGVGG